MSQHGIFATLEHRWVCNGSAQKFVTLAGGYYPLYYGVIAPGDHWILIRCAAHHPTQTVPLNYRRKNFVALMRC